MVRLHDDFEWDEDKAASNLQKHGVSFEEAAATLADEEGDALHLDIEDAAHADGEDRYLTYAPTPGDRSVILIISWTDRSDDEARVSRIISARKATRREGRFYADEIGR